MIAGRVLNDTINEQPKIIKQHASATIVRFRLAASAQRPAGICEKKAENSTTDRASPILPGSHLRADLRWIDRSGPTPCRTSDMQKNKAFKPFTDRLEGLKDLELDAFSNKL